MDGLYVLQQPVVGPVDGEAHHLLRDDAARACPIPETWMVPPKAYEPTPDLEPTLERYAQLFDLGEVGDAARLPAVHEALRRRRLGGRAAGSTTRRRCATAYEESGTLRDAPADRRSTRSTCFVRCIGLGPQTHVVSYDPAAPLHDRYTMDDGLRDRRGARSCSRDMTLTINAFFGWDFNSCEALRKDGDLVPDRLRQRLPRLAGDLAALPLPVAGEGQPALVDLLRRDQAADAREPRLGAVLRDRRRATCPTREKLARLRGDRPRALRDRRASRSSAPSTSPHLDEVAWEFFGTDVAKDAVRQKVAALFPAHEVEQFTELFWTRIQAWRGDDEARRRRSSRMKRADQRWYSRAARARRHAGRAGARTARRCCVPDRRAATPRRSSAST